MGDRARAIVIATIPQARQVGTTAVQGVRQGVEGARGWAAPRMHDAADAITASVAPRVSSALHSAATTVEPARPARSGLRRLLDWRVLLGVGAAIVAAGAAAAIATRQRYETATMHAKDAVSDMADKADNVIGDAADKAAGKAEEALPDANGRIPHSVQR
jgi:hypothetical protein